MEVHIGTICAFAFGFAPPGWLACDGASYDNKMYPELAELMNEAHGTPQASKFRVPNLAASIAIGQAGNTKIGDNGGDTYFFPDEDSLPPHTHTVSMAMRCNDSAGNSASPDLCVPAASPGIGTGRGSKTYVPPPGDVSMANFSSVTLENTGVGRLTAVDTRGPYLATPYYIAANGIMPGGDSYPNVYTGTVHAIAFHPGRLKDNVRWKVCDGSILPIAKYQSLYSLIKNTYGGDGIATFALPDLKNRVPIGTGEGQGLTVRKLGDHGGQPETNLTAEHIPPHTHAMSAIAFPNVGAKADRYSPANSYFGHVSGTEKPYQIHPEGHITMAPSTVTSSAYGKGKSIETMPPYEVINYVICMYW